jgi:uncharacterized protein involved in exopolysaccharide biosynthesis
MQAFDSAGRQQYPLLQQQLLDSRAQLRNLEKTLASPAPSASRTKGAKPVIGIVGETRYHEHLATILKSEYAAAQRDEEKDVSMFSIMEAAIVPEQQHGPGHLKLAMIAAVSAFFAALLWVLFVDVFHITALFKSRQMRSAGD